MYHCAGSGKEKRLARHVFLQLLVAPEALQNAHKCLQSQRVEHWKNSCLGFLLDAFLHGRRVQAGCSESPVGS